MENNFITLVRTNVRLKKKWNKTLHSPKKENRGLDA